MKKYQLYNYPVFRSQDIYDNAIRQVLETAKRNPAFLALYQIGSVSHPGISDIDLLAVFQNDCLVSLDPLGELGSFERALFTHGIFGISECQFKEISKFHFLSNLELYYGSPLNKSFDEVAPEFYSQIALEYLLLNYIARRREQQMRLFSVRNLLLSIKAIRFDLDLLGIKDSPLYDFVNQIIKWRKEWFDVKPSSYEIKGFIDVFIDVLESELDLLLSQHDFYINGSETIAFSRNIKIIQAEKLAFTKNGFRIPKIFSISQQKILEKVSNRYIVFVPYKIPHADSIQQERILFLKQQFNYNTRYLPHFSSLGNNFHRHVKL